MDNTGATVLKTIKEKIMERNETAYIFGLEFTRLMALNDDQTIPRPDRLIGGGGPFDFSGAADTSAVELITKLDNADEETVTLDLSSVGDIKKVTVAEVVGAINAKTPTNLTAAEDTATKRLMLVCTDGNVKYVQVYGEAAMIAKFGQGKGLRFVKIETLKSLGETPTKKESETFTTTTAKGKDTEIIGDSYRKGCTGTLVDAAENLEMRELVEGGVFVPDGDGGGTYSVPTSETQKAYFFMEAFYGKYREGQSKESDQSGYRKDLFRTCTGDFGDSNHGREWMDSNYTFTATTYTDENGELLPDMDIVHMSVAKFEALDVKNV